MTSSSPLPFPPELQAPGTDASPYAAVAAVADIPPGTMLRISWGDLDVLIAHSEAGIAAIEDRCPHMAAPFSVGRLEGCILHCPLHRGSFDLRDGNVATFPTTGGLDADGGSHPAWSPEGSAPMAPTTDAKARARALTRVRRLRYVPLRIRDGRVEIALPR
jgi:3-phenylpropionate/trans-cinnamate dioxygenase ferredoxin subunit